MYIYLLPCHIYSYHRQRMLWQFPYHRERMLGDWGFEWATCNFLEELRIGKSHFSFCRSLDGLLCWKTFEFF